MNSEMKSHCSLMLQSPIYTKVCMYTHVFFTATLLENYTLLSTYEVRITYESNSIQSTSLSTPLLLSEVSPCFGSSGFINLTSGYKGDCYSIDITFVNIWGNQPLYTSHLLLKPGFKVCNIPNKNVANPFPNFCSSHFGLFSPRCFTMLIIFYGCIWCTTLWGIKLFL